MKHSKMLVIFSFLMFSNPLFCWAEIQPVKAVLYNIYPWGFYKEGKKTGVIFEACTTILKEAGLESNTSELFPFSRVLRQLETGAGDFSLFTRNDQHSFLVPVVHTLTTYSVVISRKEIEFTQFSELNGKTLGLIRSARYLEKFHKNEQIFKYPVKNYEQAFQMVIRKRLDGFIGTRSGIIAVLNQMKLYLDDFNVFILDEKESWLHYSQKNYSKDLKSGKIKAITEAVIRLKKRKYFKNLVASYAKLPK